MALSWNEIKGRALAFSKEWAGAQNEDAESQSFLVEFFNIFGISNRRVSTFEHKVKKLDERDGYIDLLWKGTILIEMKSRGTKRRPFSHDTELKSPTNNSSWRRRRVTKRLVAGWSSITSLS